ncbi:MAG: hypothetical protein Q9195_006961 [Heterodermia aff. obscurata]
MADQAQLKNEAINTIASVSTLLRRAIGAALPVAPEQYMTVAIPGTVIDLEDYDQGGSFVYDVRKHAVPPTAVRQAEARLVDGMMPVAEIMIGNTGKSVARSYSRSLDALVPRKATLSGGGIRSPGDKGYDDAWNFLSAKGPDGYSIVETYRDKQIAWGWERSKWDEARTQAEKDAERKYPPTSGSDYIGKQKQEIADWNKTHYYRFKTAVQSAWMDWVVNGQKYNVDYNFGFIDIDSIMGRVESSKESLRNSTIPDADGANEVYGVSLTPARWATYCKRKAEGWYDRNGKYTLGQIDAEIARLEGLLKSYDNVEIAVKGGSDRKYPVQKALQPSRKVEETQADVDKEIATLYDAQGSLSGARWNLEHGKPEDKEKFQKVIEDSQKRVGEQQKKLQDKQQAHDSNRENWNAYNLATLQDGAEKQVDGWLSSTKLKINTQLKALKDLRATKANGNPPTVPVITGAVAPKDDKDTKTALGTNVAPIGAEFANPIFGIKPSATTAPPGTATLAGGTGSQPTQSAEDADPWTTVTFSYSASDLKKVASESSWGMKVGGSVGYGLWSVGGSYAHDESKKDMQQDMATCDVSVSFSALAVNINRPWLYGELFSDVDLELPENVKLSPGPLSLKKMIKEQKIDDIVGYSQFPAYPTSFIVAADTTIEFNGSTQHIEEHFSSHSNSGNLSVGYGPWSVNSSFHEAASQQSVQMHSTATGCKITFGAPQVIAWVSQILPALPRPPGINPLTQGAELPVPK